MLVVSSLKKMGWVKAAVKNLRAARRRARSVSHRISASLAGNHNTAALKEKDGKIAVLKDKLSERNIALQTVRGQFREVSPLRPLTVQYQFANAARHVGEDLGADCYVALLPSALPAAFALREQFGGKVVCDCVENVDVHKHSLAPLWPPTIINMVNHCARGAIYEVDGLMTVGDALAKDLERFHLPTLVQKNFRNFEKPVPDTSLRERCGISQDDIILFASGNVVVGFEPVLEALKALPERFHLVALVRLKPQAYEQRILELIEEYGLGHRVHILPFVEYAKLAATAAAADIGLITSDVTNPNGAVALPNRCFDYLAAGLPVVAPPMPDVKKLIETHGFGRIVEPVDATEWERNILKVAEDLSFYGEKAIEARKALTWESQDDALFDFLGRPKSVTLLSFRDLSRYQRYQRLTVSLQKKGCTVKKIFWSKDVDPSGLQENVDNYWVRNLNSLEDGVIRLPLHEAKAVG